MSNPTPPATPFSGMICFSIYAAGLAMNRLYKQFLEPFGLTYLQYLVLVALAQADGQTVSQLGEALFLESNTLTPLLKRMAAAGFVERRRDEADERVVRILLTDKGRATVSAMDCVPGQMLAASGMEIAPLRDMAADLDRLAATLREKV